MRKPIFLFFILIIFSCTLVADEVVCKVIKDNSIAMYRHSKDSEVTENVGLKKQLKIKGNENIPILQFDLSGIPQGASIEKAELTVELSDEKFRIRQIGYSSIPVDWVEGENASPENKTHEFSCMLGANGPGTGWGDKKLEFIDCISGNAGNVTGVTIAENLGSNKFKMNLPGRLIEALLADQAGGISLVDETGWWDKKERTNIYMLSKESGKGAELKVYYKKNKDTVKPSNPNVTQVKNNETLNGDILLEFNCGGDDGDAGTALGFDIRFSEGGELKWDNAEKLKRVYIPRPIESGKTFKYLFRKFTPGKSYTFGVQSYDEAGNLSEVVKVPVNVLDIPTLPKIDLQKYEILKGSALSSSKIKVWSLDELTKINPIDKGVYSGNKYISDTQEDGNYFWDGKNKKVVLSAGQGEYISFRLVIENISGSDIKNLLIEPKNYTGKNGDIPNKNIRLLREWYLSVKNDWYGCALPQLKDKNNGILSLPDPENKVPGQKRQVIFVETFVPYDAKPGKYINEFIITADGEMLKLPVELSVMSYQIPKELNFVIELNAYGTSKKDYFHSVHRLAHIFRTGFNALEYGHSGSESVPFVPKIEGLGDAAKVSDWSKWDEYMGPVLSGELFNDLPRGPVPIPHYYMPFYENYPMPVTEYLNNKIHSMRTKLPENEYWFFMCENDVLVEDGFSDDWKKGVFKIGEEFRNHFEEKGWTKTQMQLFLNNKLFKGKEKATSLWTLDEPTFGRDFRALSFIYKEFKKPFEGSKLNVVTRGDISRPSLQGNRTDGAINYNVVSSAFYSDRDNVERRMFEKGEKYWVYGGAGDSAANYDLSHLNGVLIRYWILGADGGLPYWTSFSGATWEDNKSLAIVLKGEHGYANGPVATGRLASQRRSEQDVELMIMLSKKEGWTRKKVSMLVGAVINLDATNKSNNPDDPGTLSFGKLRAENLARLRKVLQEEIEK